MSEPLPVELEPRPSGPPAPSFAVLGAAPVPHAVAPTLRFEMSVSESTGRDVHAIVLTAQIMVEPARRTYDDTSRERLVELFGAPERWSATTHPFLLAQTSAMIASFTGMTTFPLLMPCTYDMDVAATKYFHGLGGGEVPLSFQFNGSILYAGEGDRLQIARVPWSCVSRWNLPLERWRELMAGHYPEGSWIRLDGATLERLLARRAERHLPTMDAAVAALLEDGE